MNIFRLISVGVAALATMAMTGAAYAQDRVGVPTDGALWLQESANEQAARVASFNEWLLWIIIAISIFVFALMFYVMFRFREKANPEPAKFSHNTLIEVIWTVVPVIILVVIGFWSLPLLYWQETIPETEFAIRVEGKQWYWTYTYPDHDEIQFDATLVPDSAFVNADERATYETDLTTFLGHDAQLNARLLDTNTRLVVPVDTKIKLLINAADVLHAWTVPAFGVKMDAVPGRVNEIWFEANQTGTFYGQCSELCGKDHAFMPIAVEVMSKDDFAQWVERAKAEYAQAEPTTAFGR